LTIPRVSCPIFIFALLDSFLEVPRAPGSVFMFCSFGLGFDGTEGVGSRFHFLCSRTSFWRYQVCRGLFFIFCAPELIFSDTEGVGSCFHVLRSSTRFGRYHGRRLLFSFIALPDLFFSDTKGVRSVFMFCDPGLFFGGTDNVGSRFYVLRSRNHFRRYQGRQVPF
jgi:hypothetical protein